MKENQLKRGYISSDDLLIFSTVDEPEEAIQQIQNFYKY